jgi:hypothetical protein
MCYSGQCKHENSQGECSGRYLRCPAEAETDSDLLEASDKLDDLADRLYDEYKTGDRSWSSARSQYASMKKRLHI